MVGEGLRWDEFGGEVGQRRRLGREDGAGTNGGHNGLKLNIHFANSFAPSVDAGRIDAIKIWNGVVGLLVRGEFGWGGWVFLVLW